MKSRPADGGSVRRAFAKESLRLVVEETRSRLPGCVAAGVTVVHDQEPVLVLGTSLLGRQMEEAQWAARQGPGLDAIRQLQVFNVASLGSARAWPEFVRHALARGVHSVLAVPVTTKGRALGALSLYAREPDAFQGCEAVGLQSASSAATMVESVHASWADRSIPSGHLYGCTDDRAIS